MSQAVMAKNGVLAVLAAAGSTVAAALGGWDTALPSTPEMGRERKSAFCFPEQSIIGLDEEGAEILQKCKAAVSQFDGSLCENAVRSYRDRKWGTRCQGTLCSGNQ